MKQLLKFAFDIRNWLSLAVIFVFVYLSVTGVFSADQTMVIVSMTFAFYLGRETGKTVSSGKGE